MVKQGIQITNHRQSKSPQVVDSIIEYVTSRLGDVDFNEMRFAYKSFQKHQLFKSLKTQEIKAICQDLVYVNGNANSYIFKQGDPGNSFFIIHQGEVVVEVNNRQVKKLQVGDSFGELALLFRTVRSASIKCLSTKCSFMVMRPATYRRVLQEMKMQQYQKNKNIVPLFFRCYFNDFKIKYIIVLNVILFQKLNCC